MTAGARATAPSKQALEIDTKDLPLYCPGPKAPLWSMHPRVFLDVTHTGSARCPYCGAEYHLKPGAAAHSH